MVGMYIATIPNRNSPPAILLRESYREQGKVKTQTLANFSHLPAESIEVLRQSLKGEKLIPVTDAFDILSSRHHGQIDAVYTAIKRLGLENLIASRPCKERDIVVAMLIARIAQPDSKLATTRWWHTTTLPSIMGVDDSSEDDLYSAMDWLLDRQKVIEKKMAARHLREGGLVLYDLSSSYFEGATCPLATLGYNRDGKKGKLQVNYGLLTDGRGCPVAVSVFEGNTTDSKTLMPQVDMMQQRFKIKTLTLVGDRGMITQKHIDEQLRDREGVDWISALRNTSIKKLIESKNVQLELFDEKNLFELTGHPDYPGERLIACRNPELAKRRNKKRESLLKATKQALEKCYKTIILGKLRGKENIRTRVKKILGKEILDCFSLNISDDHFHFDILEKKEASEKIYADLCKKLKNIATKVNDGKLKGKPNVSSCVNKLIGKKCIKFFKLDLRDDYFSFSVSDDALAKQAAFDSICNNLNKILTLVELGKYGGKDKIGLRVGKVINRYKMEKHFIVTITDNDFIFRVDLDKVKAESMLDGVYIVRTSLSKKCITANETVRTYKSLSQVERAFRSLKSMDLHIRPIYHRLENRVRGHIFLCMLSYYVEWHMKEAWRPLLFSDENQELKSTRDPVAPAVRSKSAQRKAATKILDDGTIAHSFQTLLNQLSTIVRNSCRSIGDRINESTFEVTTTPDAKQRVALELVSKIKP